MEFAFVLYMMKFPQSDGHTEKLEIKKAFDRGLIGINEDYKIVISNDLNKMRNESYFSIYFGNFRNKPINLPEKFLPRVDFLQFHITNILR
jgi:putative restriction endonuclease